MVTRLGFSLASIARARPWTTRATAVAPFQEGVTMRTWHDVSRHTPCPICGKPDWCRISADGAWAICRRVDTGSGMHKQDKGGTDYWLYRLDGGWLQHSPAVEVPLPS